jgi:hypothetical protein
MTHRYRANPLHPVLVLVLLVVLMVVLFRTHTPAMGARTIAAFTFALAIGLQAILLFTQTEFEFDDQGFIYRERRLLRRSRRIHVKFADLERVRVKGKLVRYKLIDGEVGLVKLGWLSRSARQRVLRMFETLPQYVDDPFAEARSAMSPPNE